MSQTTLFDHLQSEETDHAIKTAIAAMSADNRLKAQFLEYHKANPRVFGEFCKLTKKTIAKGFNHYGAMGIIQLLRWENGITADDPHGFKINNNYSAFYARMFEAVYPEYRNFFRKRRSAAD